MQMDLKSIATFWSCLINLCLASHKSDIGKQFRPDQTPQNAASDLGLKYLHTLQKFLQNVIMTEKLARHPYIGNEPVQRAEVEESTWHK